MAAPAFAQVMASSTHKQAASSAADEPPVTQRLITDHNFMDTGIATITSAAAGVQQAATHFALHYRSSLIVIVLAVLAFALWLSGSLYMLSQVTPPSTDKKERPPLKDKKSGPAPPSEDNVRPDPCGNGLPSMVDPVSCSTGVMAGQSPCSQQKTALTPCQSAGHGEPIKTTPKYYERRYVPRCWPCMQVPANGLSLLVPLQELGRLGNSGFDVTNSSGQPVLHVTTDEVLGRCMQITMRQAGAVTSQPIATVGPKMLLGKEVPAVWCGGLEIYGPHGKLVGNLEPCGDSQYTIKRTDGEPLLMVSHDHLYLEFSATAPGSEKVVSTSCRTAGAGQTGMGNHFEMSVKPGGDPILAVLSVLAILFFCEHGLNTSRYAETR
eukprot:gnl/TRDRNA2_/TRDRNA2_68135_c0_seq1.p1 gnl/TRDRNA2_/TRDRNA2_68135_c0~~gnl/TRDRNA2_/TRDRNA2_68135_c0_seq1.p1  ORF type:complete len:428 (-),score=65.33 gnl/TRDRNA2_/TRDRNA2_68135_c0_seq1:196-1335(-)